MPASARWIYVDFNSYFASVEQQLRPELRGKPVAVVPVETDSTCAIAASYEAKAFGVRTGTPVYEAKRMCPGLVCVLARHEHYVEFHERICEEIDRHIPVTIVASIDEVACRLMDNEATEEKALAIAHSIKRGLAERIGEHVRCSIGIAPNRYLAKIATDMQKPDGLVVLRLDELPGRLLELKLRDLPGIGHNMEKRLRMKGIGDMRDVWKLNARQMRGVWGSIWGERMWYLLRGQELPEEETTRSTIGHSHVMAPELRAPAQARHVARRLAMKAASRLRRLGYHAGALAFSARLEQGTRWAAETQCAPAQDTLTFLHLLEALWQAMLGEIGPARLKKVSVTLHRLTEVSSLQPDLFDAVPEAVPEPAKRRRHNAERLSRAMDKLNHRYGRDTVLVGMLPQQGRTFSGTKIAFTRIPDIQEFLE